MYIYNKHVWYSTHIPNAESHRKQLQWKYNDATRNRRLYPKSEYNAQPINLFTGGVCMCTMELEGLQFTEQS